MFNTFKLKKDNNYRKNWNWWIWWILDMWHVYLGPLSIIIHSIINMIENSKRVKYVWTLRGKRIFSQTINNQWNVIENNIQNKLEKFQLMYQFRCEWLISYLIRKCRNYCWFGIGFCVDWINFHFKSMKGKSS